MKTITIETHIFKIMELKSLCLIVLIQEHGQAMRQLIENHLVTERNLLRIFSPVNLN